MEMGGEKDQWTPASVDARTVEWLGKIRVGMWERGWADMRAWRGRVEMGEKGGGQSERGCADVAKGKGDRWKWVGRRTAQTCADGVQGKT